jgi:hypothetical protein
MDGEVGLAIAIQIPLAQNHAASHGLFENSGRDVHPMPRDSPGQSDVH